MYTTGSAWSIIFTGSKARRGRQVWAGWGIAGDGLWRECRNVDPETGRRGRTERSKCLAALSTEVIICENKYLFEKIC